jgi:hypothetical protein
MFLTLEAWGDPFISPFRKERIVTYTVQHPVRNFVLLTGEAVLISNNNEGIKCITIGTVRSQLAFIDIDGRQHNDTRFWDDGNHVLASPTTIIVSVYYEYDNYHSDMQKIMLKCDTIETDAVTPWLEAHMEPTGNQIVKDMGVYYEIHMGSVYPYPFFLGDSFPVSEN